MTYQKRPFQEYGSPLPHPGAWRELYRKQKRREETMQQTIGHYQHLVKLLTSEINYTLEELAQRTGLSKRTVQRYLSTMREQGLTVTKGPSGRHVSLTDPAGKDEGLNLNLTAEEAELIKSILSDISSENTPGKSAILDKISRLLEKNS
jgi:predicted DNA-binding transcriptional regulator YafY